MKKWLILLAVIIVVGGTVRIVAAARCDILPNHSDMATYNQLAFRKGISVSPPPGYPLFLKAIYTIFGAGDVNAVYITQAILSTLTIILIFYFTLIVSGPGTALLAAGISAIYPNFIVYNLTTLTEPLALFIMMILLISLAAPPAKRRWMPLTGEKGGSILSAVILFAGCAVRPAFLYFWPGVLLSVRKKTSFILATLVILSPWLIYGLATGKTPNRGALAFYKTYNPVADGVTHYKISKTALGSRELSNVEYIRGAFEYIVNNKWDTLDIIYNKGSIFLARGWDAFVMRDLTGNTRTMNNLMNYAYLPVMFFGFIGLVRFYDRRNRVAALPALSYILFFVTLAIFKIRYRLLVEPVLIVFASILAGNVWKNVIRKS